MQRRGFLVALLLTVLAAGPSAQTPAKHFMWSVKDSKGATVYLLGSIHVLTPDVYPLSPDIEKVFDASKVLVEEVNLDDMNDPTALVPILAKAMFSDGRTLDQVVSAETFAEVKKRAEKAGLPLMAIQRMKPWMAAVALTAPVLQAAGFNAELGVDKHFFDAAKKANKERRALETVAYQLDRFDQLSMPLQEAMLKSTMADLDTEVGNVKELVAAWKAGNTTTMERLMLGAMLDSPELYQRLLVERNVNWISHVEKCLQENSGCFVVVGAAHLVGPQGLPTLLQKKGYTVRQQ
jgi:uncharacterized protein YbaP (TraB family)